MRFLMIFNRVSGIGWFLDGVWDILVVFSEERLRPRWFEELEIDCVGKRGISYFSCS